MSEWPPFVRIGHHDAVHLACGNFVTWSTYIHRDAARAWHHFACWCGKGPPMTTEEALAAWGPYVHSIGVELIDGKPVKFDRIYAAGHTSEPAG